MCGEQSDLALLGGRVVRVDSEHVRRAVYGDHVVDDNLEFLR